MDTLAKDLYKKMRKDFWKNPRLYTRTDLAKHQWETAKYESDTISRWERYGGVIVADTERVDPTESKVRLRIVPDDLSDIDDLAGDVFDPEVNSDIPRDRLEHQREEFIDRVNRDGVWGIVGEFYDETKYRWEHADSCWGFVGDEWETIGYKTDIMATTVDEYEKHLDDVLTEKDYRLIAVALTTLNSISNGTDQHITHVLKKVRDRL